MIHRGALLHALVALAACGGDARREGREEARAEPVAQTDAVTRLAAFDAGIEAIEAGLRASPRDRWDAEWQVQRLGREPAALFAWVRDSTAWIPYRGLLRGPVGVLMDREGNSLDRALLLGRLLQLAGHETRLARVTLPLDFATAVLPAEVARREALQPGVVPPAGQLHSPTVSKAAYRLESPDQMSAVQEGVARELFHELERRVREQSARLLREVDAPDGRRDWTQRRTEALAALRDHWWVQRRDGDRWIDLDPLRAHEDGTAARLASETMSPEAIPDTLHHRLTVRVIAEQWSNGSLTEHGVLERTLQPAELSGRAVLLQVWPGAWPAELHSDPSSSLGLRGAALGQREWAVALSVGGVRVAEGALAASGRESPADGAGPFGELGQAIGRQAVPERSSSEMTAAWIEYELHAPGAPPRTIRRAIFDLVGPAARSAGAPRTLVLDEEQRLVRSLALMIRTEILPVASRMAPQYALHLSLERLLDNRALLRLLVGGADAEAPPDSILSAAMPALSPLYSLAYARTAWSEAASHMFVDRLGLLTRHRHPAVLGTQYGMRGAFDVAFGEMGVSLAEPDAFSARLRQGVLDTNAEALWWAGIASLNTGEVFGSSSGWTALHAAGGAQLDTVALPADAAQRIAGELESGAVVVAPRTSIPVHGERFVGWWRIDPRTGVTRGVSGNGWGQCNAEYTAKLRMAIGAYIDGFMFEFALCEAIALSINGFRGVAKELQRRHLWFWWMPPINVSDPKSVIKDNAKFCLVGAMTAGFLATMPILLMAARAEEMLVAARLAAAERDAAARAPAGGEGAGTAGSGRPSGGAPDGGGGGGKGYRPPGASPDADPLANTQPGSGKTPELGKTQDLGKTQPDMKTNPGTSPSGESGRRQPGSRPTSQADAEAKVRDAHDKWKPTQEESSNRTGDWIRYNSKGGLEPEGQPGDPDYHPGRPADPDFNPDHLAELEAKVDEAQAARNKALADLIEAEENLNWARKAVKRGEIPFNEPSAPAPEPAGCPPSCNNSSSDAPGSGGSPAPSDQLMAGSSNLASSFWPHSWSQ